MTLAAAAGKRLAPLALLALLALPQWAAGKTLAVTFFDTNTTDPRLEPLGRGLASMLITDLSPLEALTVVERSRMSEILDEMAFQKSPYVDQASAVQVGKGLGAEWVLTGAVATLDTNMRLDARLVEVGSGRVLETQSVTGATEEFFLLEKELAAAILDKLEVRMSSRESAKLGRVATESFDAFVAYSQGLEALDRGAMEDARKALEAALGHDDRFGLATSMLDDLRSKLKDLDARRAKAGNEQAASMLARIAQLKADGGPYDVLQMELVPVSSMAASPVNARAVATIAAALMDLGMPEDLRFGGPQGVYSLNEWAMYAYTMSQQWMGRRTDFLTYGQAFLERYPASVMAPAFASGLERLLTLMEEEEAGRSQVARTRVEAMGSAMKTRCISEKQPSARLTACRTWFRDSDAAGIELDGDAEEMWARAASQAGNLSEIETVLARARAREQYGEAAEDIARTLERAQKNQLDADKALGKLAEAKKPYDVRRVARDLADAGRIEAAFAAVDEGYARFGTHGDLFVVEIELATTYGDRSRAEDALQRWEAAAASDPEISVDSGTARRVLSWDEQNQHVNEADALALLQLAIGLMKIGQRADAGDAYMELATKYPTYSSYQAPIAISTAANMYYAAWEMEKARTAYELLLSKYADSDAARGATSMLSLLPE